MGATPFGALQSLTDHHETVGSSEIQLYVNLLALLVDVASVEH